MNRTANRTTSRQRARVPRITSRTIKKRETRQRILASARHIARREGLRAASVPRVMGDAGLTVGGFYAHFDSKTSLDAEVIRTMLGDLPGRWLSGLEDSEGLEWLARAVSRYLRAEHRDNLDGCSYPAVLSEVARSSDEVRRAFAEAFKLRVAAFEQHAPATNGCTPRQRALATMALTIGGLLLARAAAGDRVSDEVLAACRRWALPDTGAAKPGTRGRTAKSKT